MTILGLDARRASVSSSRRVLGSNWGLNSSSSHSSPTSSPCSSSRQAHARAHTLAHTLAHALAHAAAGPSFVLPTASLTCRAAAAPVNPAIASISALRAWAFNPAFTPAPPRLQPPHRAPHPPRCHAAPSHCIATHARAAPKVHRELTLASCFHRRLSL